MSAKQSRQKPTASMGIGRLIFCVRLFGRLFVHLFVHLFVRLFVRSRCRFPQCVELAERLVENQ